MHSVEKWLNRVIEFSFYGLFFFIPLAIWGDTSELFEFNKMWLTFGLTIVIVGAWICKMIVRKQIFFQRTLMDIPILLFLLSQTISTFHSIDVHISLWGYYSRFNGGLLSILSYILLYYAFVSNFFTEHVAGAKIVKRMLLISLASAAVVALWGLPSHFGYDPTCLVFRGSLDVSCWTADFQPKIRIFSTLGQPDWLAAYFAILLPLAIVFGIKNSKHEVQNPKQYQNKNDQNTKRFEYLDFKNSHLFRISDFGFLILSILFYIEILFTGSKSGVLGVWAAIAAFLVGYLFFERKNHSKLFTFHFKLLILVAALIAATTFLIGTPFSQLDKFTFTNVQKHFSSTNSQKSQSSNSQTQTMNTGELGGTDSGKIRLFVWQGAIDIWKANPLFGTGVETFAFAYYGHRPIGHNMTSEWNFLYNKAHNEYLNYLATTGAFGLGTYLLMIGWFLYITLKYLLSTIHHFKNKNSQTLTNGQSLMINGKLLTLALLAGYLSILITNFFGFSVVIVNIYLFLIPAFVFGFLNIINPDRLFVFPKSNYTRDAKRYTLSMGQWICIASVTLIGTFMLITLARFWLADKSYGLGYNLDRAGQYQQAYQPLHDAVTTRGDEPVFKDEMAINDAVLSTAFLQQKTQNATQAAVMAQALAQEAISTNDQLVNNYPNNLLFWKSRFRIFYTLAQVDPKYYQQALIAMQKASVIAPTDPTISYYLGVLYGQNGQIEKAVNTLRQTIQLKPDYRDAHFALGLFYHQLAFGKNPEQTIGPQKPGSPSQTTQVNSDFEQKAVEQLHYILDHLGADDKQVIQTLQAWGEK